jgi:hypothetical protein
MGTKLRWFTGLCAVAMLAGCPLETPSGDDLPEPTTASVYGRWTGAAPETLVVAVEGDSYEVAVLDDGSFALDGLPTGDQTVNLVDGDRRGQVRLQGVAAGERVHLRVDADAKALHVGVVRRAPPRPALVIDGNDIVQSLPDGAIDRDLIVRGNDVRIVGGGCDRTVLYGRLLVHGNNISVEGVDVRGEARLDGNDLRADCLH